MPIDVRSHWKIELDGSGRGRIERDGQLVEGVQSITVRAEARRCPTVQLTFLATSVLLVADKASDATAVSERRKRVKCAAVSERRKRVKCDVCGTHATLGPGIQINGTHLGCGASTAGRWVDCDTQGGA